MPIARMPWHSDGAIATITSGDAQNMADEILKAE
jgi:hypothetical protein